MIQIVANGHLPVARHTDDVVGSKSFAGIVHILNELLTQAGTNAAENVLKKEFVSTPYILYHTTEHPECKHIKEQMRETGMHEHICQQLM